MNTNHRFHISLFHAVVVGPLLLWVGWNKQLAGGWAFALVLILGALTFGYHARALWKMAEKGADSTEHYEATPAQLPKPFEDQSQSMATSLPGTPVKNMKPAA